MIRTFKKIPVSSVVDPNEGDAVIGEKAAEGGGDVWSVRELEDQAVGVDAELEGGGGVRVRLPLDAEADDEGGGVKRVGVVVAQVIDPLTRDGGDRGNGGLDCGGEEGCCEGLRALGVLVVVAGGGDVAGVHFFVCVSVGYVRVKNFLEGESEMGEGIEGV